LLRCSVCSWTATRSPAPPPARLRCLVCYSVSWSATRCAARFATRCATTPTAVWPATWSAPRSIRCSLHLLAASARCLCHLLHLLHLLLILGPVVFPSDSLSSLLPSPLRHRALPSLPLLSTLLCSAPTQFLHCLCCHLFFAPPLFNSAAFSAAAASAAVCAGCLPDVCLSDLLLLLLNYEVVRTLTALRCCTA
jgi:hypothetical protein